VVYGYQRTADAVNPAPGLTAGLVIVVAVYLAMTVATVYVLRRLAHGGRAAPQEPDTQPVPSAAQP
jgi:cytochrome d ubiquinol oxidase subunit I